MAIIEEILDNDEEGNTTPPPTQPHTQASSHSQNNDEQEDNNPLAQSEKIKLLGNQHFSAGQIQAALEKYTEALNILAPERNIFLERVKEQFNREWSKTLKSQSEKPSISTLHTDENHESETKEIEDNNQNTTSEKNKIEQTANNTTKETTKNKTNQKTETKSNQTENNAKTDETGQVNNKIDEEEEKKKDEKKKEEEEEKIDLYEVFRKSIPEKHHKPVSVLYANMGACYQKLGDHDFVIETCSNSLKLDANYVKPLLRRASSFQAKDELDLALEDYQKVLVLDKTNLEAKQMVQKLPGMIHERNERIKKEAIDKLKEVGNKFLGLFGLSTDNFQFTQDSSGGYSVQLNK